MTRAEACSTCQTIPVQASPCSQSAAFSWSQWRAGIFTGGAEEQKGRGFVSTVLKFMQRWSSSLIIDQWMRSGLEEHKKKNKSKTIHIALLYVESMQGRCSNRREEDWKNREWGKKLSVRSSYIRLLCLWCGAKTIILRQNERISIYDSVCGQTWAQNHTLLLFISSAPSANYL